MKKINLIILSFAFVIFGLFLVSCTNSQKTENVQLESGYYTCPMHPTIVQDEEGDCPICGMDLVYETNNSSPTAKSEVNVERKIKYWVAPMDPNFISDVPGKSPMGMDLIPVYEDEQSTGSGITIDPTVVQNMGVRLQHISYRDISHNIRTIGKVEIADDEKYSINLRFSGWIEKIFADKIGQKIKKGDKLFEIYSPELITAQEEYLLGVNTYGKDSKISRAAKKRLLNWNIPQKHLDKILSENNAQQNLVFTSPFSGFILHKTIQAGSNAKAGTDLYHIGNLATIWIIADIYEFDAGSVKIGQKVTVELTNLPSIIRTGKISYIYPTLNPKTRTQKIRIELENSDLALKPEMFATVRIEAKRLNNVLTVPTEAIINTGERKIVFVSRGNGKFESREIKTGLSDDTNFYSEVVSGLQENEIVVVSGQFLLDSESQLQEAVQKLLDVKFKPDSLSETDENHVHSNEESIYFTCPMHPTIVQDKAGECPICGMDLIEKKQ